MTTESSLKPESRRLVALILAVGLCAAGGVVAFQALKKEPSAAHVAGAPPPAEREAPAPSPGASHASPPPAAKVDPAPVSKPAPPPNPKQMFEDQIKKLTPEQFRVTQHAGTERPFTGKYWDAKEDGVYVDVVSGKALFSSLDKFDSGCGWPSFSKPIDGTEVKELSDETAGMIRTEVRSSTADSHLGHVFEDGPTEMGGLRYCINSASLRFVPVKDLEKEGLGQYRKLFEKKLP